MTSPTTSPTTDLPDAPGAGRTMAVVGLGFVGRRVARAAAARGWTVRGLVRTAPSPATTGTATGDVEVVVGEAQDPSVLARLLAGADHVVHAAGSAKPAESQQDPVADAVRNLEPLLAVLEACRSHAVRGLTFLSSGGTVYGPDAPVPTPEDAPLWPISSYGVLKVAGERYVALHAREAGFAADVLRCANAYGPGEPTTGSQGFIGIARARLLARQPITVYGDGAASRDYLHVDDLADVVVRLAERPDGLRVLNVGSGVATSIQQVIDTLAADLGIEPVLERRPARATDVPVSVLDVSRLRTVLDFDPRPVTGHRDDT